MKRNKDLFYYLVYDESVTQLCNRINTNALTWGRRYNIEKENDIILAHAIYKTIQTTHLYRKDDVKSSIWEIIMPLCKIDESSSSSSKMEYFQTGFDDLFDYCWEQKFSKTNDERGAVKLYEMAYKNRPLSNKLVNSNFSIILFAALFFAIEYWINWRMLRFHIIETHELLLTVCVMFIGIVITESLVKAYKSNAFYKYPLICMAIMCVVLVHDLFDTKFIDDVIGFAPADTTLQIVRRDWYMGLSYLLWYPIIYFNKDRLYDCGIY